MLENQVLAWDRHKNVAGLNRINDPNPTVFIIGRPMAIRYKKNNKKNLHLNYKVLFHFDYCQEFFRHVLNYYS
jgi:hypothetical protein